ncbi:MAG: hypothetical protein ACKVYV_16925 [Limisphaerales bacterium]
MRYWLHHEGRVSGPLIDGELHAQAVPGDSVLPEGSTTWLPFAGGPEPAAPPILKSRYHHVAAWKFVVLWVTTLGLHEIWWAWRGWRHVRERDQCRIRPFWRGLFFWIWLYPLLADIARASGRVAGFREAVMWLAVLALHGGGYWLPDPWWLLSLLGFLPLLPAVRAIDRLNHAAGVQGPAYGRLRWPHLAVLPAGGLVLAAAAFLAFRAVPYGMVTADDVPAWIRSALEKGEIVGPGEDILFFYSTDIIGVRDDGNLLTDERVMSWTTDTGDGEFELDAARFDEIEALEFTPAEARWDEAMLHVRCAARAGAVVGGRRFNLYLSGDNDDARRFIAELRRRAPDAHFTQDEPESEAAVE